MNLPKPKSLRYDELIASIKSGKMRIPQFQRDFVWDLEKSADLLDSILKGYPIGTFIIWKTTDRLKTVGALGDFVSKEPDENEVVEYILDGQQRITSLFIALNGYKVGKVDYSKIYVDLRPDVEDNIVLTDVSDMDELDYISFSNLLDHSIVDLMDKYVNRKENVKKIEEYMQHIKSYDFSIIEVPYAPIDVATEIFTRINVKGKTLSVFEIMCARIFDVKAGFDLSEQFDKLLEDLQQCGFEKMPSTVPLQLISLVLTGSCKSRVILSLRKEDVIDKWEPCKKALMYSIDYVKATFAVPYSGLLPYDVLLIPIAYYILKNNYEHPTGAHNKYLKDMFWRNSLTQRYNNATETKLAADIAIIDEIINKNEYKPPVSIELNKKFFIDNGAFKMGRSFTKAMLCFYLTKTPLRLDSHDTRVITDNSELIKGNGKNYHHFFPRAFMRGRGVDENLIDNIINIIIVDDYTNKYKIKDKAPSVYIKQFSETNDRIGVSLASHMIGDLEQFGVVSDNYQLFFSKRVEWISQELSLQMCLESAVIPDDEQDDDELSDASTSEAYTMLWEKFRALLNSENCGLQLDDSSALKVQAVTILSGKVYLRFAVSATKQSLTCEILCRDEAIYQKLLMQESVFNDLAKPLSLVWSDADAKAKKITCEYPHRLDIFSAAKHERYIKWMLDTGITLQENIKLFLEDVDIGRGQAPEEIKTPIMVFCKSRSTLSQGRYLGKRVGFEILSGSEVKLSSKAYGASQNKRNELIESGVIKKITDAKGEFTECYICSTPSQAADILLGGSNNGWITWKEASGKTLDQLYRCK